jgi:hypothetical protein
MSNFVIHNQERIEMKDKVINRCVRESANAGVAVIRQGRLVQICRAVNDAISDADGNTNYCIFASAILQDVLMALGHEAGVMRVEAALSLDPNHDKVVILGLIGGDIRLRPPPDMWSGHLIAIADGQYLLDATLDQVNERHGMAFEPLVAVAPRWWFDGDKPIFIPVDGRVARYTAFPNRGGFKYAPDFRPSRRREIVRDLVHIFMRTPTPER